MSLNSYLAEVQCLLGVVCRLHRIQSSRYEIGLQMQGASAAETTYTSLVCSMRFGFGLFPTFFLLLVDTLPRKHQPRKAFCYDRDQGPTSEGLRWQVVTVPISLGSRSRIRI